MIKKRNVEDELVNWELYKAYGHFNLCFESVVATFREFLIEMIRLSYGFDVDWEDPADDEPVASKMQDRLMKIILYDDGASAIIEKCRSCFVDMANPEVQKVLADNDIQPLPITKDLVKIGEMIFKKSLELVQLRNIIIHSHYQGVVYNLLPIRKLRGKKNVKTSKGFEERTYELTVEYLNKSIEQIEDLEYIAQSLSYIVTSGNRRENFDTDTLTRLEKMNFKLPKGTT